MEVANKDHMPNDSTMNLIQASSFYEHNFVPTPSLDLYRISEHPKIVFQDSESPKKACGSSESSPSSINSSVLGYQNEGNPVIRFNPEYGHFVHVNGSLLSFDQAIKPVRKNLFPVSNEEEYQFWDEDLHPNSTTTNQGLSDTSIGLFAPPSGGAHIPWASSDRDGSLMDGGVDQDQLGGDGASNKRLYMGENVQVMKKQCVASPSKKQPKSKSASPISKDPQSMAAKNRRERISERLKILQDLVPNGSKVDLVTMLEKAIGYVKFLQLQVKVLATDEFWPAQGGKAPDLTQVKEAIDAILASSQRDRSSSSK